MNKRTKFAVVAFLALAPLIVGCPSGAREGPVLTPTDAVARARIAWQGIAEKKGASSVYGEESTARFEPYTATVDNDVWIVRGTVPAGYRGQTLETRVAKTDGQVSVYAKEVQ